MAETGTTTLGKIPIFIRLGDGEETHVGDVTPTGDLTPGPDGDLVYTVTAPPMAEVFRALADAFEAGEQTQRPPA